MGHWCWWGEAAERRHCSRDVTARTAAAQGSASSAVSASDEGAQKAFCFL